MRRSSTTRTVVLGGLLVASLALPIASGAGVPTPLPPISNTGYASELTHTSAVLHGSIYPNNQQTDYYFQYGPTAAYGAQTPQAPAGAGTKTIGVSTPIAGLSAGAAYHFRLVALSPGGTTFGSDRTFSTPKIPLSLTAAATPDPVAFGSPVTVEGTLSGSGNAGRELVLQANPFPYDAGFHNTGSPELTNANGGFSFAMTGLQASTRLRVESIARPVVASSIVTEDVAVRVTVNARRTRRHGFVLIYGTVTPAKPGARVALERLTRSHRYVVVSGTTIRTRIRKHKSSPAKSAHSRFSRIVHIRHGGLYRVLVVVSKGPQVSGESRSIMIR